MGLFSKTDKYGNIEEVYPGRMIGVGLLALLTLIVATGSWYTVDAGERVVVLRFGAVNRMADQGLHTKLPLFESLVRVQTRIGAADAKSTASSKDLQVVHTNIVVNYAPQADRVGDIYRTLGREWEARLVDPMINEVFKSVTAKFTAEELITRRHEASTMIENDLRSRLLPFGFQVHNIAITNFDFSEEFNHAIEQKQTAEQLALKAGRDLDRVKKEAEQKIEMSRAEAAGLALQKAQITPELLQLRAIEKWNGVMPQFTGGGAIPFVNLKRQE